MEFWGKSTAIDLYNCDPLVIRSKREIKIYTQELINLIRMKAFGEIQIIHFGKDEKVEGYSFTQLIETSLISGHFCNSNNNAYIDIFSCDDYSTELAVEFSRFFFRAASANFHVIERK